MIHCVYCGATLPAGPAGGEAPRGRWAYDPWRGRLWRICACCARWSPYPLELRWELLEALEKSARARGRVILESENLSLIQVDGGELVRVGRAPRREFVSWRYGDRLPVVAGRRQGLFVRLVSRLPSPPLGGYDPYRAVLDTAPQPWIASPFLEHASLLTAAFTTVPFAPSCPSCGRVMPIRPWDFQRVRLHPLGPRGFGVGAACALCGREVALELRAVRPALRLGLALVTSAGMVRAASEGASWQVDQAGDGAKLLGRLAAGEPSLGDLSVVERTALTIVLDEQAELEALEAEWRAAEEIAAIMDGELSQVAGFEDFRRRILSGE